MSLERHPEEPNEAPWRQQKICAGRVLPVSRSMIAGTVSPA
jgi:hypothetical protein